MRRFFFVLAFLAAMAASEMVLAADATVIFEEFTVGSVKVVKATWTQNATANATGTTTKGYFGDVLGYYHAAGTADADMALTITDALGLDILGSNATGLTNSTNKQLRAGEDGKFPFLPVCGQLTYTFSGPTAGGGTFYTWIR